MWSMHAVSEEDRLDREGARRVLRRTIRLAAPWTAAASKLRAAIVEKCPK